MRDITVPRNPQQFGELGIGESSDVAQPTAYERLRERIERSLQVGVEARAQEDPRVSAGSAAPAVSDRCPPHSSAPRPPPVAVRVAQDREQPCLEVRAGLERSADQALANVSCTGSSASAGLRVRRSAVGRGCRDSRASSRTPHALQLDAIAKVRPNISQLAPIVRGHRCYRFESLVYGHTVDGWRKR